MNFTRINDEKGRLLLIQFAERSTAVVVIETLVGVILGFAGIAGNSLVCLAVYRSPRLQTKCNYYVTTLAGLDWAQTVLAVVLALPVLVMGRWSFGDVVCQMQGAVTVVLATGSIYIMMLIAVNRYLIVMHANFHRTFFTKKKTLTSIAISLMLSGNFVLSYALQGFRYTFHPGKAMCTFDISNIPFGYGLPVVATNVTIPFLVIFGCYTRIYLTVREYSAGNSRQQEARISPRDIDITKALFVTVCAFAVCWTPFVVVDVASLWFGPYGFPRQLYFFHSIMAVTSGVLNPLIYGVMYQDFRREFRSVLGEKICCRRRRIRPEEMAGRRHCQVRVSFSM